MRILVTGGAGFIGSHTVEALLAAGHDVIVYDDLSTGRRSNLPAGIELVEASILEGDRLTEAMQGCEAVLHLAAIVSVPFSLEQPIDCHAVNATGSLQVLECARRAGVRRVAQASSAAVYGDASPPIAETAPLVPLSPYGLQKRMAEEYGRLYALHHGLEVVSLRYFNVFGPRQDPRSPYSGVLSRFALAAQSGQPATLFGDGLQTRDFVYVGDVALANLAALTAPAAQVRGEVQAGSMPVSLEVNVGTGQPTTVLEAHAAIAASSGCLLAPSFGPPRAGDILHSCAKVDLARERLGWQAASSFREGVARLLAQAPARVS